MSLFSDRKLIEVQVESGKPGTEGSKAIQEYLAMESDDVLLIVAGKIDKQSQRAKWYTALDQRGAIITVWPVGRREMPSWIQTRLKLRGMSADRDAVALLSERVEGNLLAAAQEIEKLSLLASDDHLSVEHVAESVGDSARYNTFGMVDTALSGDARGALRALRGLQAEGNAAPVILWPVSKELRLLIDAESAVRKGTSPANALDRLGVWRSRINLLQSALARHNRESLEACLSLNFAADGSAKGYMPGNCWDYLESLIVTLATGTSSVMPRRR
jgi:DNA polymerase-3 subunit delta